VRLSAMEMTSLIIALKPGANLLVGGSPLWDRSAPEAGCLKGFGAAFRVIITGEEVAFKTTSGLFDPLRTSAVGDDAVVEKSASTGPWTGSMRESAAPAAACGVEDDVGCFGPRGGSCRRLLPLLATEVATFGLIGELRLQGTGKILLLGGTRAAVVASPSLSSSPLSSS